MQGFCDCVDGGTMAGKFVMDRAAHQLEETILVCVLPQLFLELRREQIEQFGIPRHEWLCCVQGAENNYVLG